MRPSGVWALRPYDYGEPQQPVCEQLRPAIAGSDVEAIVPDFRYYSLVVFRFAK